MWPKAALREDLGIPVMSVAWLLDGRGVKVGEKGKKYKLVCYKIVVQM